MAAAMVPTMVARGIVRSGSFTCPAGMVAVSSPRNAHNVSVIVAMTCPATDTSLAGGSENAEGSKKNNPPMPTTTSGISFRTSVTTCRRPASRTPMMFTPTSSQIATMASMAASAGVRTIAGMKGSRYPTKATARAESVAVDDSQ